MKHLAFGVQRVRVHKNHTGTKNAVYRNRTLHNVRHLNRDTIAWLQGSMVLEIGCECSTVLVDFTIGQSVAYAGECFAVSVSLERTVNAFNNRIVFIHIDGINDTGRTFAVPERRIHRFFPCLFDRF